MIEMTEKQQQALEEIKHSLERHGKAYAEAMDGIARYGIRSAWGELSRAAKEQVAIELYEQHLLYIGHNGFDAGAFAEIAERALDSAISEALSTSSNPFSNATNHARLEMTRIVLRDIKSLISWAA